MASIEQLERKVLELENQLREERLQTQTLLAKSNKALETALHAYKVDHFGFIWVYQYDTKEYARTDMRVISPELVDEAVKTRHLADGAVTGEKIAADAIDSSKIKDKTIEGRSIKADAIGTEQIKDQSITGDPMEPGAVPNGKLANNAVSERTIQDRAVTAAKIALGALGPQHFTPESFAQTIAPYFAELQHQIDAHSDHGGFVSDSFGDDRYISISQKTLTDAWNNIYHLLEEALNRNLLGFTWDVTPTYIYGEWPTTIHITATPTNPEDRFEYIKLSVDGEMIDEVTEKVPTYEFDINLQDTVNIRIDAQVLGVAYYRETEVRHYDSFWLGGGTTYTDIMNEAHNINFSEGTRLAKDVTCNDGDHIIIMMGESWVPAFIRADMNGVEIEFKETPVTIDGKNYKVLTSKSEFEADTYNIDING